MTYGWSNSLLEKLMAVPNIDGYDSYYFKTGDTILYNKFIQPLIQKSFALGSKYNN